MPEAYPSLPNDYCKVLRVNCSKQNPLPIQPFIHYNAKEDLESFPSFKKESRTYQFVYTNYMIRDVPMYKIARVQIDPSRPGDNDFHWPGNPYRRDGFNQQMAEEQAMIEMQLQEMG